MSTVVEVLRRGRELYASAPSHVGEGFDPDHGTHCVLTATLQAVSDLLPWDAQTNSIMWDADNHIRTAAGTGLLASWNAENSTETVLEAWDRAIAAAEAKA